MPALNGKKIFSPGRYFGTLNTVNPTPMRPGVIQDQSVTFKREVKEIFGENQLPADGSSGTMSVTGKVTFGASNARLFTDLFFSDPGTTNSSIIEQDNEVGTPAGTPLVVTVANSATWTTDLGVKDVTTGNIMVRVAAASEVTGVSYSVAAGIYRFATGDSGNKKISYLYTSNTAGELVTLTNQKQGKAGVFTSVMVFPWQNQAGTIEQDVLTLNVCLISDHEISTKQADYGKPTLSFSAFCDANDNLGTMSFAEAA